MELEHRNKKLKQLAVYLRGLPSLDPRDSHLRVSMPAYLVTGKYLLTLLMEEIRANTTPEVFDEYNSTDSIVDAFRRQLAAYTYQESPFTYTGKVEPRVYWKTLVSNQDASVLAVSNKSSSQASNLTALHPLIDSWTQTIFCRPKLNG
jgi:hypothetical protein